MEEAVVKVAESIQSGEIIQLFDCSHSHILTEEVCYRAGGLVPINLILYEPLMLHEGALRSFQLERQNDLEAQFMKEQDIRIGDIMFFISTSGHNPVLVDVAEEAKAKGYFFDWDYIYGKTAEKLIKISSFFYYIITKQVILDFAYTISQNVCY